MTATADIEGLLSKQFPSLTPRPSADHPAFNAPAADVLAVLRALRDEHGFDFLADLTAIDDGPNASPRFTIVWHLYSTHSHEYVRITSTCSDSAAPTMPTSTALWPAADWHEREVWDMFGIKFIDHPDLRRILMWDGYPYHPLRKDFPLAGLPADLPDEEIAAEIPTKLISAPMAGGPFVALSSGGMNLGKIEPRAKDEAWNEHREKPQG